MMARPIHHMLNHASLPTVLSSVPPEGAPGAGRRPKYGDPSRPGTAALHSWDSDDTWERAYLEEQMAAIIRDGVDLVYCNALTMGPETERRS